MKKLLVILLAAAVLLTGCSGGEKAENKKSGVTYDGYNGSKSAVMTVNGEEVSADEFNYFLIMAAYDIAANNKVLDSDRTEFWDKVDENTGKSFRQLAFDDAIDNCKTYHVYRTWAKDAGLELSEESLSQIDENNNRMKKNYGEYMNELQLKAGGLTPEVFEDMNEMSQYSVELYSDFTVNYGEIPEDELKAYYEENYVRAKHILVLTVDPETNEELSSDEKNEALKKISEVKGRLEGGEAFENLIDEYNEDPGMDSSPDGYTFTKDDSYSKDFIDTAFSLEIDGISEIVQNEYGYSIIKRCVLLDEYMNAEKVSEKVIGEEFQKEIDKHCDAADVRLNAKVYDKLDPEKTLADYLGSQDGIMADIQKEYERIYAEEDKAEASAE